MQISEILELGGGGGGGGGHVINWNPQENAFCHP